jgi:DNA replication and repair protein RecF
MRISRLRAYNLRKIQLLDISPSEGINLIWGANGSGKTTLLEAIHILHSGKSFRPSRFPDLVTLGEQQFGVRGDVYFQDGRADIEQCFKVQKERLSTNIEINAQVVTSASVLAKAFPLLIVEPNSFGIVDGGPRLRRSLLDRATFHVEQGFLKSARNYTYALAQRNRLLKANARASQLGFWGEELARYGEEINAARTRCVDALNQQFNSGHEMDDVLGQIRLKYRKGWKEDIALKEALALNLPQEVASGITLIGPHKAEIEIQAGGSGVARTASRGQIKTIVISIVAALSKYIFQAIGIRPVMLVDDFAAELDDSMCSLVLRVMSETHSQAFISSINDHTTKNTLHEIAATFHVKQGSVKTRH